MRPQIRVVHAGRKVNVPIVDGIGLQHRELTEPHAHAALRACLGLTSGAFVDGGAHLGETLLKLIVFGTGQPYGGFEPTLGSASYGDRILLANPAQSGVVIPAAAG